MEHFVIIQIILDTYYLLTSADHNTVQINRIESDGRVGEQQSTLSK
jgi:hypothetical protein